MDSAGLFQARSWEHPEQHGLHGQIPAHPPRSALRQAVADLEQILPSGTSRNGPYREAGAGMVR